MSDSDFLKMEPRTSQFTTSVILVSILAIEGERVMLGMMLWLNFTMPLVNMFGL